MFEIPKEWIEKEPDMVIKALRDVVVVNIENNFMARTLVYYGYSKNFDLIEEKELMPKYVAEFHRNDSKNIEFVKWNREKEFTEKDVKGMLNSILEKLSQ